MPLARATVTFDPIELEGLAPAPQGTYRYVIAKLGGLLQGRSRPLPAGGGTFRFEDEPSSWRTEVPLWDAPLEYCYEVWRDGGDAAPVREQLFQGQITPAHPTGPLRLTSAPSAVALSLQVTVASLDPRQVVRAAPITQSGSRRSSHARVRTATNSFFVELTDIVGAYRPHGRVGERFAAERVHGYVSQDNRGRVYLNRGLDGAFRKDVQFIRLECRLLGQGVIPPETRVRWSVSVPDDPSDADPNIHVDWLGTFDENDYRRGAPSGTRGGDNLGHPARTPPWEAAAGFAISHESQRSAESEVVGGQSAIVLHCPDCAGDRFVVRAEAVLGSTRGVASLTGMLTMWNRIDVDYIKMQSAQELPVREIPPLFELVFTQLDFAPVRIVPDRPALAASAETRSEATFRYTEEVFIRGCPDPALLGPSGTTRPGWFCLVSAMHCIPPVPFSTVFDGEVTVGVLPGSHPRCYLDVPAAVPTAMIAEVTWGSHNTAFRFEGAPTVRGASTRLVLDEHDLYPTFRGGRHAATGSSDAAYRDQWLLTARHLKKGGGHWHEGGYALPERVHATITSRPFIVYGMSPFRDGPHGDSMFCGRTVFFTHSQEYATLSGGALTPVADYVPRIKRAIMHELFHAFGTPHKCGRFDYKTPRQNTCAMNYDHHWMIDRDGNVVPDSGRRVGYALCGRHLRDVRTTHLEDNPALGW